MLQFRIWGQVQEYGASPETATWARVPLKNDDKIVKSVFTPKAFVRKIVRNVGFVIGRQTKKTIVPSASWRITPAVLGGQSENRELPAVMAAANPAKIEGSNTEAADWGGSVAFALPARHTVSADVAGPVVMTVADQTAVSRPTWASRQSECAHVGEFNAPAIHRMCGWSFEVETVARFSAAVVLIDGSGKIRILEPHTNQM